MMQITDLDKEQKIPALFRLGFRPMFLFGTVFSVIAITVWILVLNDELGFRPYGGSYWWHGHEMMFGFVSAIIVGFLLTAVQNWTGLPGVRGKRLAALFLLWLVARIGLALPKTEFSLLFALVDIAFMPVSAVLLAEPLVAVKQVRNLFFVPVLTLFAVANGFTHAAIYLGDMNYFHVGVNATLYLIALLMVVVGGRVTPGFTANGTNTVKVAPIGWLEQVSIGSVVALMLVHIFDLSLLLPEPVMGALFVFAGVSNFIRCLRWRIWIALRAPLVWSLHIAYFCMSGALIVMGLVYLGLEINPKTVLHLLTVGGMGGLSLAMMSRVSLGHTGRELTIKPLMTIAFLAIFVAALIRVVGVLLMPQAVVALLSASAVLWVIAFGLFLFYYVPMLLKPRVDGRPG